MNSVALEERVEGLEAQCRLARGLAIAALTACGIALLLVARQREPIVKTQSNVRVEAKQFAVTDSDGVRRAVLEADSLGPSLALLDPSGKKRVELAVQDILGTAQPIVALSDSEGNRRVVLSLSPDSAVLELSPKDHGPTASLTAASGMRSAFSLTSPEGQGRWPAGIRMILDEGGMPSMTLTDSVGFETEIGGVQLTSQRTGEARQGSAASLVLLDKTGKAIWSAP